MVGGGTLNPRRRRRLNRAHRRRRQLARYQHVLRELQRIFREKFEEAYAKHVLRNPLPSLVPDNTGPVLTTTDIENQVKAMLEKYGVDPDAAFSRLTVHRDVNDPRVVYIELAPRLHVFSAEIKFQL
jgi:hypothetical protein